MLRHRFFTVLSLAVLALSTSACGTTPRLDRQFGRSVDLLRTQQIINPLAAMNQDPVSGMDGRAANAAYEAYQKSFTAPTPQPAAFSISVGGR